MSVKRYVMDDGRRIELTGQEQWEYLCDHCGLPIADGQIVTLQGQIFRPGQPAGGFRKDLHIGCVTISVGWLVSE